MAWHRLMTPLSRSVPFSLSSCYWLSNLNNFFSRIFLCCCVVTAFLDSLLLGCLWCSALSFRLPVFVIWLLVYQWNLLFCTQSSDLRINSCHFLFRLSYNVMTTAESPFPGFGSLTIKKNVSSFVLFGIYRFVWSLFLCFCHFCNQKGRVNKLHW